MDEGVKAQTKKHAYILKLLGIKKVITLFNKMDKIAYDKKFLFVKKQLEDYLNKINVEALNNIPISAKVGDNILSKSKKIKWYSGDTLINVLDEYNLSDDRNESFLRFPVQDIYKLSDKELWLEELNQEK